MRRAVAYRLRAKSPKFLHAPRGSRLYRSFFGAVTGLALLSGGWSVSGLLASTGPPVQAAAVYDTLHAPVLAVHGQVSRIQARLRPGTSPPPVQAPAPDTAALQHTVPPSSPSPVPSQAPAPAPSSQSPTPAPTSQPQPSPPPTSSGGWPDGALGACIVMAESGGNAQIWNPSGHWGLYQFDAGTWAAYGGPPGSFGNAGAGEQEAIFMNVVAAGNQAIYDAWESDGCPQKFGIF